MGTAQNVEIYKRHGAGDNLFGVSFANLGQLKRKIKTDHELAFELWETGNVDAQTLATMVVDKRQFTEADADAWLSGISYYMLVDLLADVVSGAPCCQTKMQEWMGSDQEYTKQCGYVVLSSYLKNGGDLDSPLCRSILQDIEKNIHAAPNRARHAMNMAMIAIGVYKKDLTELALEHAGRIGQVQVDHGQTRCHTPDAVEYIKRGRGRRGPGAHL